MLTESADPSTVTTIAFDLSITTDGEKFVLKDGDVVSAKLKDALGNPLIGDYRYMITAADKSSEKGIIHVENGTVTYVHKRNDKVWLGSENHKDNQFKSLTPQSKSKLVYH